MTDVSFHDDIVEIRISDERVDAAAAPSLKRTLDEVIIGAPNKMVLDLEKVQFMDSTGLGVFVSLVKKLGPDGAIAAAGVRPAVERLFQLTRLDTLFRLVPDVATARALLRD